ncbi:MAG TPA: hypothetical protein VMQ93_02470 [Novosphingobium sp.]|nr:hypothetical protein [Novosphingobium sp.]
MGAVTLGTLAGATIPTSMTSIGTDWREKHGAAPAIDGRDYYVEPAAQDLSPYSAGMAWDSYQPPAREDARQAELLPDYASYSYDSDRLGGDLQLTSAGDEEAPEALPVENDAPSAETQAAKAAQVAEDVREAEAQPGPPATTM